MFKYKGVCCPHCGEEFKESDQILICPECGAPYHRRCIEEIGSCKFSDLHEKGESWQPPKTQPEEEKYDGMASRRCSRCGTINGADMLFCEVCGNPLNREAEDSSRPREEAPHMQGPGGQPPFHQMAYNPYTTPFGGLGADEEVDGIPVKDLALYVGQNTHYFLPKFKEMINGGKGTGWNWAAFFLDAYYFFYRKMWGWGVLTLFVSLLISVPSLIIFFNAMLYNYGGQMFVTPETLVTLDNISNICTLLSLGMKLAVATFSNRLYKDQVFENIKRIRAEKKDAPDYTSQLTAKGGVSIKAVVILVACSVVFSFISSFIMISAITKL